jgi:regulation of enolase protein 1 (concanavalin A-like superfamily)
VFDITQDVTVRANFVEAASDLTLTVNVAAGGAVDIVPQKATYQYGELVTLVPRPNSGYQFSEWSGDHTGSDNPGKIVMNDSKVILATFVPANTQSPVSDDFNACALDTSLWKVVNPVGDGTVQVNGQQLLLQLPAGLSHNIWLEGNRSLRIMQPTEDENFEIVAKFDSKVLLRYQMQGFLVEQDDKNFLRFEVHHDGSAIDLYAATFTNGLPQPVITGIRVTDTPAYLRVTRSSDTWSFSYSFNGTDYFPAGSFEFPMAVTSSGVFAGIHTPSMGLAPQFTAVVDYFFNAQSPIVPEDGNINVTTQGQGTVSISPDKETYSCGESITLTATPANGWSFFAWGGDITGNQSTKVITFNGRTDVTATFTQGDGGAFTTYLPAILKQ